MTMHEILDALRRSDNAEYITPVDEARMLYGVAIQKIRDSLPMSYTGYYPYEYGQMIIQTANLIDRHLGNKIGYLIPEEVSATNNSVEQFGKGVIGLFACIGHNADPIYVARLVISTARDVVSRQGESRRDIDMVMYGIALDTDGVDLDVARKRAEIAAIRAKTAKDRAEAARSAQQ